MPDTNEMKFNEQPHDEATVYSTLLSLNREDRRTLEFLCEDSIFLRNTTFDCAIMWREQLRSRYDDPTACRRKFLVRASLIAAKHGILQDFSLPVAAAFALCICDKVEARVLELDREETCDE